MGPLDADWTTRSVLISFASAAASLLIIINLERHGWWPQIPYAEIVISTLVGIVVLWRRHRHSPILALLAYVVSLIVFLVFLYLVYLVLAAEKLEL